MRLRYFLIIVLISVLLIPMTDVFAPVDLQQFRVKVVVDFEYPKNINALRGDIIRDLVPQLNSRIQNFGEDYIGFNYELEDPNTAIYSIGINQTSGNIIYQIYPKVIFSGTNPTMTQTDFESDYNILTLQIEMDVINFLLANGGSQVDTHLHLSWGSIDFDKGF